jgi:hypothetical protein
MDYFAKFLTPQPQAKHTQDPVADFHKSWIIIKVSYFYCWLSMTDQL